MPARKYPRPTPIRTDRQPRQRLITGILIAAVLLLAAAMQSGCQASTPTIVRIGLVAPFDGRYREIGYDVIPAARLAIREWAQREQSEELIIELVAYDDLGSVELAIEQAQKLAADPAVVIVIGHWREETTQAALPVYAEAGLPLITFSVNDLKHDPGLYNLAPSMTALVDAANADAIDTGGEPGINLVSETGGDAVNNAELARDSIRAFSGEILIGGPDWGLNQFWLLTDTDSDSLRFMSWAALPGDVGGPFWTEQQATRFSEGFTEGSLGVPPGLYSASAYEATWLAIKQAAAMYGIATGDTPADAIRFDESGRRIEAPIYYYAWDEGQRALVKRIR